MRLKGRKDMPQWKYQITIHELPESKAEKGMRTIKCDQSGVCFVHDAFYGNMEGLEDLFDEKGKEGWELVQCGYHNRELLCIWKKKKEAREKV
jgi:hypothetical protein